MSRLYIQDVTLRDLLADIAGRIGAREARSADLDPR